METSKGTPSVDRRTFIAAGASIVAGIGGFVPSAAATAEPRRVDEPPSAPAPPRPRRRALRVGHLTDIHVQPERAAAEGMAAALRHAQSLADPVQFIVTGGDMVMDAFDAEEARVKTQWDLFASVLRGECSVPVAHCLGNHDIWGGNRAKSHTTGREPRWGKAWAREVLGLAADHQAFDRAGWRFIVLDSVRPDVVHGRGDRDGYTAYLEPAQRAWLEQELASTPATTPIVVVSHVPLLTVTVAASDARRSKDFAITVPGDLMHSDAATVAELFARHANVKLCLSGHIHQVDRVEYRGATYICDGAVSGAWWKGPNGAFPEGYGVVDLFDDGTFEWAYTPYGWTARP